MDANTIKIHFLDSSTIIKLIANEPDSSAIRTYFNNRQGSAGFHTTHLCVAEALGVLKRRFLLKRKNHQANPKEYFRAVYYLMGSIPQLIRIIPDRLEDSSVTDETQHLAKKYHLDFSDALQLCTLKNEFYKGLADSPRFITADQNLALAARAEGLRDVWNCVKDPTPT
jgi:predicted nucleic acid-binding protein